MLLVVFKVHVNLATSIGFEPIIFWLFYNITKLLLSFRIPFPTACCCVTQPSDELARALAAVYIIYIL